MRNLSRTALSTCPSELGVTDRQSGMDPTRTTHQNRRSVMRENQIDIPPSAADSYPITETMDSILLLTRREMLGMTAMAGMAAVSGIAPNAVAQTTPQKRPRIACLVSYWGLPTSHADWIITKLLDGYWWHDAHTPSRVDVVSVYINQFDT